MRRAEPTHYQRLGVARSASATEIRTAYRALARRTHPDVNGSGVDASMAAVNEAWRVLGDPDRRAAYDASLVSEVPVSRARRPDAAARPGPSPGAARADPAEPAEPADPAEPRPAWWNEPVPDEPESDLPITDGRVVQAFGLLVAVATTIALVVVGLLFAYAIFWSK
jgi:curved DNA-binding protein CbpA